MMPKIVDAAERRADIARACWRVIVRHGIAGVTTRELAREAGVSPGALFHYFADKETIIAAAFELLAETYRQKVRDDLAPARTSLDRLRLLALSNLPLAGRRTDEFGVWLSMWAYTYSSESLRVRIQDLYGNWRIMLGNMIRDAIADGHLRDDLDPELAAAQLACLTDGFTVHMLVSRDHPEMADLAIRAVDELLHLWVVAPVSTSLAPNPT